MIDCTTYTAQWRLSKFTGEAKTARRCTHLPRFDLRGTNPLRQKNITNSETEIDDSSLVTVEVYTFSVSPAARQRKQPAVTCICQNLIRAATPTYDWYSGTFYERTTESGTFNSLTFKAS